ncbi:AraC family transcriptional regulator [Alteribacillus sp. YIM 98480]|uniref:helix-turn-helix transcriptional regulator n=1 Tax=Alteribacillus sp. YIM 98480 TaxID=2606599 RepID=UPI00131D62C4|nr:AraC family transcriptional regulator [Alteribacillus sp. YIM 98480]
MYEKGVLPTSQMYFFSPSEMAKQALYYLIYAGDFYTTADYYINRDNWNSYLIMVVEEGEIQVEFDGNRYIANKNSLVLLNCYKPHIYFSRGSCHFKWFHFTGNASDYYYEHLYEKHGCIFEGIENTFLHQLMDTLIDLSRVKNINEELISIKISQMLYELNNVNANKKMDGTDIIERAVSFLKDNFQDSITLDDIASEVNLSPYYFLRVFKKDMGETPIHYLIQLRLNEAKYLLHNTDLSVAEIAFKCGFNSESHFITTFKKNNMLTPSQFRGIRF